MRKKIFILFLNLGLGGVQRGMVDLANTICNDKEYSKFDVEIILRDKVDFEIRELLDKRVVVKYCPRIFSLYPPFFFFFYILLLTLKFRPLVLFANLNLVAFYCVFIKKILFWRDIHVVINQWNVLSCDIDRWRHFIYAKIFYPLADWVIVQTEFARRDLMEKFDISCNQIRVLPSWSILKPKPKKKKYDLIYVGRFVKQKNLMELIDCVGILVKKMENINVLFMGDGEVKAEIEKEIKVRKLGDNIEIKSPVIDVASIYAQGKIFVLTSKFEGMSLSMLEAMSCGLVPVIKEFSGINEYLKNDKNGIVVKDIKKMAEKIEELLISENVFNTLAVNAKKSVNNNYGKSVIKKYIDLMIIEPRQIVLTFFDLGLGGMQRLFVDFANYVSEKYINVKVLILLQSRTEFNYVDELNSQVEVKYSSQVSGLIGQFFYGLFIMWNLSRRKVDGILTALEYVTFYVYLSRILFFWKKIRIIVHHGIFSSLHLKNDDAKKLKKGIIRFVYPKVDCVVVPTESVKKDLLALNKRQMNLRVIPNWTLFNGKSELGKKYDLVYVGRFTEQKKLLKMLECIDMLKKDIFGLSVLMVGEGKMKRSIELEIDKMGLNKNIEIRDPVIDMKIIYGKSKVFVMTSEYEGMSVAVLEAMSCGVVPVVLEHPGIGEYVENGVGGFIEKDISGMVEKIMYLLGNNSSLNKMSKNAGARASIFFGSKNIEKYVSLLKIN